MRTTIERYTQGTFTTFYCVRSTTIYKTHRYTREYRFTTLKERERFITRRFSAW